MSRRSEQLRCDGGPNNTRYATRSSVRLRSTEKTKETEDDSDNHNEVDSEQDQTSTSIAFPLKVVNFFGLKHELYDEDGTYKGMCCTPSQAAYIWALSWLSLCSGLYAFSRGYFDLALVPIAVWCTSIIHWVKPMYGWRRNLDVSCVHVAFSYQVLRSIHCENVVIYLCVLAVGVACFFVGNKYKLTCPWFSILSHSLVHILGNVANFILYSGKVPPPDTLKQLIL